MSSIQERLQLKRVPLDTWNIREQLCLASAVVRSGDQNWMSVSRALKTVGEPNRPADWYSQKSCAAQYGALLEHVETPKRKKRSSEGAVETPQESILKRLTQERIVEIQKTVAEMNQQYEQLKSEILEIRSQATSEDRLRDLWTGIEAAKRARERENAKRAAWLKEREERRARAERTWRPPAVATPTPVTPTSVPPASPLLTSLLKSSPVVTTPQHIPHPATVVETVSPSAGAPTLSMLLEKSGNGGASNSHESKHAAIEHIKSQLVQIEQQWKASTSTASPVSLPPAPAPAVDIDDIEIKAEDVYAFRDIDIHIPPVAAMHKPPARVVEKPVFKKDELDIVTPVVSEPPTVQMAEEDIKQEVTEPGPVADEILQTEVEPAPEETMAVEEQQPQTRESEVTPETEVKIAFPEVKFPTPEIKVIQPEDQKIKEEIKEPEMSEKEIEEDVDVVNVSTTAVEEESEKPPEPPIPVPPLSEPQIPEPPMPEPPVPEPEPVIPEPEPLQSSTDQSFTEQPAITAEEPEAEDMRQIMEPEPVPVIEDIPLPPDPEPQVTHEKVVEEVPLPLEPETSIEAIAEQPTVTEPTAEVKEETVQEQIVEESQSNVEVVKSEELVAEDGVKKDEDAEDSIPLKEMLKDKEPAAGGTAEVKEERPPEPEDTHTETDDDTPMELSREEEKDGKKKRDYSRKKKSDSRTCSGSESAAEASAPDSPSATDAERQHRLWKKSVMLVYSRLCAHKYASLFLRPITDDEAPGYSVVVKRPMDLGTIKRNIEAGLIRTTAQFQRDVLLMLSNALMYNSSEHSVYQMAKDMHEEAQCQLGMLLAAQAHAGLTACVPARRKRRRAESPLAPKRPHY